MKKLYTIILSIIIFGGLSFAQTIIIHTSAGMDSYNFSDIDSITFDVTNGSSDGTVTDIDGNVYETVQIGDQIWMAENLKVTHFRDGTVITNVTDNASWGFLSTEAYCIYNNNASNEVDTYGALYNWFAAVDSHNIAPAGWHVPTDDEWKELEMALGMSQSDADDEQWRGTNEGSKLAGNAGLWDDDALENDSEFGSSGFTTIPAGYRYYPDSTFLRMGTGSYFWSVTVTSNSTPWLRGLYTSHSEIYRGGYDKRGGFSIRCVKD